MTSWFALNESSDETFETAASRFTHVVDVPAPRERVWEALAADDAIVAWSPLVTGIEWLTPRPFGVGTSRIITLGHGAVALRERFYRWDEGERMTFTVDAASRPGFENFAEDLKLEDEGNGTTLTWTFVSTPISVLRPAALVGGPGLRLATRSIAHGIAGHLRKHTAAAGKGTTR
ncbi:SRPBCC family protein [Antrihabitans cavernicola]|uniref:SRPBCC family protein n=1 Tax=Antrihabitans cavernicola TaxID=2495913 RepID=A0A5A7SDZ2_9NOCA|nr:SRPBCC family protein [Spelaeibacter cavernicola]KAA0022823.1 SRPBCC family protein [Spelaeibacter cavernicola]